MTARTLFSLLTLLAITAGCYGYSSFQQQIPNGEMVPHPCKANFIWRGVGHDNHLGGGPRNSFGVDFANNNKVWDPTLCNKDSDSDGKTNGEELGDPDCTWTPGAEPKHRAGLSHPGICDPFDSPRCSGKPEFVDCTKLEFKCDGIEQPDLVNFTARLKETSVPPKETVYKCMLFDLPDLGGKEHHIMAHTPYIDAEDVVHHILVYACKGQLSHPLDQPYACDMQADPNCTDIIGFWSVGLAGHCMDPNAGFLIGGAQGYKTAAIEIHWNNPQKKSGYMDSSGLTFFATPKLRPNNAGTIIVGQGYLQIPPGREGYGVHGSCDGACTQKLLMGDINVVSAINHMHYLGTAQITTLHRNGKKVSNLTIDRAYSYDFPVMYDHREPIVVRPGDDIETTCVYKTTSRTKTVFWGEATTDEMCLSLLVYYPKENAPFTYCFPWKDISYCERTIDLKTKDGCDFGQLYDYSDPKLMEMFVNITQKCHPLLCVEECKDYIRELRQTNSCFKGQNYEYLLATIGQTAQAMPIFTRAASCDAELVQEQTSTSAARSPSAIPLSGLIALVLAIWYNFM